MPEHIQLREELCYISDATMIEKTEYAEDDTSFECMIRLIIIADNEQHSRYVCELRPEDVAELCGLEALNTREMVAIAEALRRWEEPFHITVPAEGFMITPDMILIQPRRKATSEPDATGQIREATVERFGFHANRPKPQKEAS